MAAARAALQWDPLQAVATEQPVAVIYIAESRQAAAFMTEWDAWRAAGVSVFPLYVGHNTSESEADESTESRLPEDDRCAASAAQPAQELLASA